MLTKKQLEFGRDALGKMERSESLLSFTSEVTGPGNPGRNIAISIAGSTVWSGTTASGGGVALTHLATLLLQQEIDRLKAELGALGITTKKE